MDNVTRTDLVRLSEEALERLKRVAPKDPFAYRIRMTSGTTGEPLVVVSTFNPASDMSFGDCERVVSVVGNVYTRLGAVHMARRRQRPVRILALSRAELSPALRDVLADFSPDCLIGVPSLVANTSPFFSNGIACGVRLLALRGEYLSSTLHERLCSRFRNARVDMRYLATEIGLIGVPACGSALNQYHPVSDVRIDIGEPDGSGMGEVLITVRRQTVRVRRYRIGDIGRLMPERCACGRVVLELFGRSGYDYVKCAGAILRREEFDRVVALFPSLIADYRAEISEVPSDAGIKGKIVMRVSRTGPAMTEPRRKQLTEEISRHLFLTSTRTLEELVADGSFYPLEVRLSEKPLPHANKESKLVRGRQ